MRRVTIAGCAVLLAYGACGAPSAAAQDVAVSASPLGSERARAQIIPLVDHHQHIFGPDLVDPPTELLPEVTLPADVAQVLRDRERVSGTTELGDLFAEDARMLDVFFDTDRWVAGPDIAGIVAQHGPGLRFVANAFHADGSAAFVSGIVHADDAGEYDKHFSLGLRRDAEGRWRIASEAVTDKVLNPFREPLDAETLIERLDDAGIGRATVLSTAYWLANPRRPRVENEQARVSAANDWVIEQTARYPERLIPFCAVNPLSAYAIDEMRRCAANPRVRGMKLHFANARADLKDADHLAKVRGFFRAANEAGLAIVVHLWPRGADGPEYTRIFIADVLSEAPDVPVQIAHLGSGAPEVFDAVVGVFAEAVAARDPRTGNLYFDVTEIISEGLDQATVDEVAIRLRQIGLDRVLFGSDTPLPRYRPPPLQAWATFRRRMPFSDQELRTIAENEAPYLHARRRVSP